MKEMLVSSISHYVFKSRFFHDPPVSLILQVAKLNMAQMIGFVFNRKKKKMV